VPDPPPEEPNDVDGVDVDVVSERRADVGGAGPIDEPRRRTSTGTTGPEPPEPDGEADQETAEAVSVEDDAGADGREEMTGGGTGPVDESRWWEEVDHDTIPEVPDAWRELVYAASSKWIRAESFAEDRGMAIGEYLDAVNGHTRQLLADGRLCMYVPPTALWKIVADNRFKNQHRTGTTRGFPGRGPFEERMLGVDDPGSDPESAPVYGFVCADPEDERHEYRRHHYGQTIVVFSDRLRARTTFTVGDSLDENLVAGPTTWASPVNAPDEMSQLFGSEDPLYAEEVDDLEENSYVEAQYWGPVTVDDIQAVYVDDPDLASSLREAGVEAREFLY